jgi:hypothetical protein
MEVNPHWDPNGKRGWMLQGPENLAVVELENIR